MGEIIQPIAGGVGAATSANQDIQIGIEQNNSTEPNSVFKDSTGYSVFTLGTDESDQESVLKFEDRNGAGKFSVFKEQTRGESAFLDINANDDTNKSVFKDIASKSVFTNNGTNNYGQSVFTNTDGDSLLENIAPKNSDISIAVNSSATFTLSSTALINWIAANPNARIIKLVATQAVGEHCWMVIYIP